MATISIINKTGLDQVITFLGSTSDDNKSYTVACGKSLSAGVPSDLTPYTSFYVQSSNISTKDAFTAGSSTPITVTATSVTKNTCVVLGINNPKNTGNGTLITKIADMKAFGKSQCIFMTCAYGKRIMDQKATSYFVANKLSAGDNVVVVGLDSNNIAKADVGTAIGTKYSSFTKFVGGLATGDTTICQLPFADKLVSCDSTIGGWSITLFILFIILLIIVVVLVVLYIKKRKSS